MPIGSRWRCRLGRRATQGGAGREVYSLSRSTGAGRGPDARDRLSADQAPERAIGGLHLLRGLTRAQQRRVLERVMALLER